MAHLSNSRWLLLTLTCSGFIATSIPASVRESFFERTLLCGGNVTSYSGATLKTTLECGLLCAADDKCTGYARSTSAACVLYNQSLARLKACTSDSTDTNSVYVKQSTCLNGGSFSADSGSCKCIDGYVGTYCERLMQDCSEGYTLGGYRSDQKYWIKPTLATDAFKVYCQMSQGTGITRLQARTNANIDFNRTWLDFKVGFEITDNSDFWLGNEYIHWITSSFPQVLMVQLSEGKTKTFQRYHKNFTMSDGANSYAVSYTTSWSKDDDKIFMDGCWANTSIKFSTWDRDNDGSDVNCAQTHGAGFWFASDCGVCNPNGRLYPGQHVRLNIPNENFWTPTLGNWTPDAVNMVLFRI
ncbi:unnamed protein product [Lymnaea stagnalis]|uniref:Fibrinogen C-terminal domain-containing protein n=1 Tax=Lymnaea stagnalis TaxID=6523 RepID=A0AAV2H657_LYMST